MTPSATTADGITQALHYTTHTGKQELLLSLLKQEKETVLILPDQASGRAGGACAESCRTSCRHSARRPESVTAQKRA